MINISTKELQDHLSKGDAQWHFIDVRSNDEWEEGVIPGVELVSLHIIPLRLSDFLPQHHYVFICRSGNRSGQACSYVEDHGIPHVYNYEGGMLEWNALQLPLSYPE